MAAPAQSVARAPQRAAAAAGEDLAALIAHRRPGFTLPPPLSRRAEVFPRYPEFIFGRHWIFVGTEPEIAEAGDFFTVEIGADSVIIVREDDLSVGAFHNVFPHPGAGLRP